MLVGSKCLGFFSFVSLGNYYIYDSDISPLLNISQEMGKQNRKCHSAIYLLTEPSVFGHKRCFWSLKPNEDIAEEDKVQRGAARMVKAFYFA